MTCPRRREYYTRFPHRLQEWLDAGEGSCVLAIPEPKRIVENALRYFDGHRYSLDQFAVAPNHVHVLLTPLSSHTLSSILHSWKSFTAHQILNKVAAASRRCSEQAHLWQKESFDHIVRSPQSLGPFRRYIQSHVSK